MAQTTIERLKSICCTCLSTNRKLSRLSNLEDAVSNLFCLLSCDSEAYDELCKREVVNLFICWECQALMYKICLFRDQACLAQKQLRHVIDSDKKPSANICLSKLTSCYQNYECAPINNNTERIDGVNKLTENNSAEDVSGNVVANGEISVRSEGDIKSTSEDETEPIYKENNNFEVYEMSETEMLQSIKEMKSGQEFVEAEYKCEDCIEVFSNGIEKDVHLKESHLHTLNHTQCDICRAYIPNDFFENHRNGHYFRVECHYCDFKCYNLMTMMNHLKKEHSYLYTSDKVVTASKDISIQSSDESLNMNDEVLTVPSEEDVESDADDEQHPVKDKDYLVIELEKSEDSVDRRKMTREKRVEFVKVSGGERENIQEKYLSIEDEDTIVNEDNEQIYKTNKNYTVIKMTKSELLEYIEERKSSENFVNAEFKCEECVEVFRDDTEREVHINEAYHTPVLFMYAKKKNYKRCDICRSFVRYKLFNEHRHDHFLRFKCNYCDFDCHHILIILKHLKKGHSVPTSPQLIRKLRKRAYVKSPGLKPWLADVSVRGESAGYLCSKCDEFFETKKLRDIHTAKAHYNRSRHQCSICNKMFTSAHILMNHERLHDNTVPRSPCPTCGKLIRSDSMKGHMRKHEDRKMMSCFECDKVFVSEDSYRVHMKYTLKHRKKDAFKITCPYCDKGFKTRNEQRDHVDYKHLGKIRYKCEICNKLLSSGRMLRHHVLITHDPDRKKRKKEDCQKLCQACGTVCRDHTAYKEHLALHTGEKAYACDVCPKRFRTSSMLYAHRKKMHNLLPARRYIKQTEKNEEE